MRKLWIGLFFTFLLSPHPGYTSPAAKMYRCHVKDMVSLQDDGMLGKDGSSKFYIREYDGIIVDTLTGVITYADGRRERWKIIQHGNNENDRVLIPSQLTNPDELIRAAATDFIRVRDWPHKAPPKWIAFALSTLITGLCEALQ